MMGGWHDDVVDMMVWMLTMITVRNSEVFFELSFLWKHTIGLRSSILIEPEVTSGSWYVHVFTPPLMKSDLGTLAKS